MASIFDQNNSFELFQLDYDYSKRNESSSQEINFFLPACDNLLEQIESFSKEPEIIGLEQVQPIVTKQDFPQNEDQPMLDLEDVMNEDLYEHQTNVQQTIDQESKTQELHASTEESDCQSQNSLPKSNENTTCKTQRKHLKRQRKARGERNQLQSKVGGYWTKNFLQFGKKPHFQFIEQKMGADYIEECEQLRNIKKKAGIKLQDYLSMYFILELRAIWKQFFNKRILYRSLMLSRVEPEYRKIFVRFLHRYQEAYESGEFDHIA